MRRGSPRCSDRDEPDALSREHLSAARLAGWVWTAWRRGRLALKGCPNPASPPMPQPAGLVIRRHNLAARPGPGNCLFWTNSSTRLPKCGSGSAGPAHLTAPASRGGAPAAPLPKRVPGAERGARRGRLGSPRAAPARPRGGTDPAPTGPGQAECPGRPVGPRHPYPQDMVALGAAAGDVDALRGAHGRKRAATGTWHRALPPPGARRGPTAAARGHGRAPVRRLSPPGGRRWRRHVRGGGCRRCWTGRVN